MVFIAFIKIINDDYKNCEDWEETDVFNLKQDAISWVIDKLFNECRDHFEQVFENDEDGYIKLENERENTIEYLERARKLTFRPEFREYDHMFQYNITEKSV